MYDGENIIAEISDSGETIYLRDNTGIVSRTRGNAKEYFVSNYRGDTTAVVNANADILKSYEYDAFGNIKNPTSADDNPFRYCGEYFDDETGFVYLRNRYYDPSIGRFTTEDPAKSGLNWYAYCENNPVKYIDPWGLKPGDVYRTPDEVALDFSLEYAPKSQSNIPNERIEYGALILGVTVNGVEGYTYLEAISGTYTSVSYDTAIGNIPSDTKIIGVVHTHPATGSFDMSNIGEGAGGQRSGDIPTAKKLAKSYGSGLMYLASPTGKLLCYDPLKEGHQQRVVTRYLPRTQDYEGTTERYMRGDIINGVNIPLPNRTQHEEGINKLINILATNKHNFDVHHSGKMLNTDYSKIVVEPIRYK